ncbi:DUF6262 family protein [Leekyejoonella antrihumi]|uniref:Transposase n=1 Tax=Leekyejoonella antrihumi TaxID=1660198 RepID=A0A563DNB5_9MICO|nr:DUF6262 family protein [Leekyejoonella antrihumi]TWP31697.1 transposase [Leekyejoonella antrihumi]
MKADNSRHLADAARVRAERTRRRAVIAVRHLARTGQPLTVTTVAEQAEVSRSWLYTQADLLDQIRAEQPRTSAPLTIPTRQAASDSSLKQRLEIAHQRIRSLEADNQQLRDALAQALGDRRATRPRYTSN